MHYSDVLAALTPDGEGFTVELDDSWFQGRSPFGGLQAALAVTAMRQTIGNTLPLRVLQVSFIAPIPVGRLRIEVRPLRQGRSVTHVEARLLVGDDTACLVVGIFGQSRESSLRLESPFPEVPRTPEASTRLPYIEGVTPAFTQHIEFSWAAGGFPFSAAKKARTQIYLRMAEGRPVGEAELIALADAIPSPGLSMLKKVSMASSLSWTLEFLTTEYERDPQQHWLFSAEVTDGADGYLYQTGTLWSPDRRPVVLSRQSVVVFG